MHSNNIGSLRFIGAFFVLFGHGYTLAGGAGTIDPVSDWMRDHSPFALGLPGLGVALFFALSGYLVTASFVRRGGLIDYSVARALRIYPALVVAVLFCAFFVELLVTTLPTLAYVSHFETLRFALQNSSLLGIHHTLPGVFSSQPWGNSVNGSLWTLPLELLMYAAVACAGVCGFFKSRLLFNALALVALLCFLFTPAPPAFFASPAHFCPVLAFLFGALLFINRESVRFTRLGCFILLALCVMSFKTDAYNAISLFSFTYFVLALGLSERTWLPAFDKHGDFSYGLYLYAFPLQQIAIYYVGGENVLLINTLAFSGAMCLAVISWRLVEKPCLALKKPLSDWLTEQIGRRKARIT